MTSRSDDQGSASGHDSKTPPAPAREREGEDGPLDSIGKAISDPVKSAAEDEEPGPNGVPAVTPGG